MCPNGRSGPKCGSPVDREPDRERPGEQGLLLALVAHPDVVAEGAPGTPGVGLVFGANPVTLSNGVASTSVTANLVQTYNVRAETQGQPSINGIGPAVTVVAAPPAGTITATALPPGPITANGTSTTTITSGVIRDQFTNQVAEGLIVNVSANIGGRPVRGSSS